MWVCFYLLIILVIFSRTDNIAGWSNKTIYVLMGSVFLMSSIFGAFCMSLMEVPEQVRKGTLDFVITKPVDTQFWVSFRRFNFDKIGSMAVALIMLIYGVVQSNVVIGPLQWGGYVLQVFCAICIYYSLCLLMMTLSIYFVRIENLWVLSETVLETARFPIDIYGPFAKQILMFYVPIGLLATAPASQLMQGFQWQTIVASVVWAGVSLLATRYFWNFTLRRYTSASS